MEGGNDDIRFVWQKGLPGCRVDTDRCESVSGDTGEETIILMVRDEGGWS